MSQSQLRCAIRDGLSPRSDAPLAMRSAGTITALHVLKEPVEVPTDDDWYASFSECFLMR